MSKNRIRRIGPALGLAITMSASPVLASSHREAPLIAQDPTADSTDVYAFLSLDGPAPGAGAKVTLIANYIPFQEPSGGPNYFNFSDSVLYEIKVDNTGDAVEDIVYQFRFTTTVANGDTFLYNTGSLNGAAQTNRNVLQTYTLTRVDIADDGARTSTVIGSNLKTAPPRIGPRVGPHVRRGDPGPRLEAVDRDDDLEITRSGGLGCQGTQADAQLLGTPERRNDDGGSHGITIGASMVDR